MIEFEKDWVPENYPPIIIIGAGMAGISVALELKRLGVSKIVLLDENEKGHEGPWITTARMRHLRSGKNLLGPATNYPELSFSNYYQRKYGNQSWETLYKIPNELWNDYLLWLREELDLKVENKTRVLRIDSQEIIWVHTNQGTFETEKVVLATGRHGFGGLKLPDWTKSLPREKYAHTSEPINFEKLKGKKIAIVGTGASGWDAAGVALERGAGSVDMLCRHERLHNVNKAINITFSGYEIGYYFLSDNEKLEFANIAYQNRAVPPFESVLRVKGFNNFHILYNCDLIPSEYDFVILATGFEVNAEQVPYLQNLKIDLWENHLSESLKKTYPFASRYPYLGENFELLPNKNIYCFNYAATLSHGLISSDIPGIGVGAERLAKGIVKDIFLKYKHLFYQRLKDFDVAEFDLNLLKD